MRAAKLIATLAVVAGISFLMGFMYGERSVPLAEKHWQAIIDDCHRFLAAGLPADFGRCVASPPRNSN
jgi:hypothetical protein